MAVVRRSPQVFGYTNVRWKLSQLLDICDWLRLTSPGGLSQLLQRLGISYKRGRDYVHSPDRHYVEKLDLLQQARLRAYDAPERYVFTYADQLTYYRQPSLAQALSYVATPSRWPNAVTPRTRPFASWAP